MDSILSDYLAVAKTDLSPNTIKIYTGTYRRFSRWLDEQQIDLRYITQPQVQQYITEQVLKASTLKTQIKAIRAAFRYGQNCTLTIQRYDDPFARLRYPVEPEKEPITYSNEEILRLYNAIETDREWITFHLFAYAGLRRAEVCGLDWEHVDFEQRHVVVVGKGNKLRRIPLHPKLAEALAPYRSSGPVLKTEKQYNGIKPAGTRLDPDTLHRSTAIWFSRADLFKAHNHCFRRTMTSVLGEKGVSKETIDHIMGWAPKDIQNRYYRRFLPEDLQDAIRKLDYTLPRSSKTYAVSTKTQSAISDRSRHLQVVA